MPVQWIPGQGLDSGWLLRAAIQARQWVAVTGPTSPLRVTGGVNSVNYNRSESAQSARAPASYTQQHPSRTPRARIPPREHSRGRRIYSRARIVHTFHQKLTPKPRPISHADLVRKLLTCAALGGGWSCGSRYCAASSELIIAAYLMQIAAGAVSVWCLQLLISNHHCNSPRQHQDQNAVTGSLGTRVL